MGWYYRRWIVPRILPQCKKIITVSNFECNRIKKALHLCENQITAIYNGYNQHFHPIPDVASVTENIQPKFTNNSVDVLKYIFLHFYY